MNDGQPMPNIQRIPLIQEADRSKLLESQQRTPHRLQHARHFRSTPIARVPLVMRGIKARCGNPCTCFFGNSTDIQNMVEMTMSYDDSDDALAKPSTLL